MINAMPARPQYCYRTNYNDTTARDHLVVTLLRSVLLPRLKDLCKSAVPNAKLLDAGCGRQPLRGVVESHGVVYYSQDVIQNIDGTAQFICPLDDDLAPDLLAASPFDIIICTEVLEHVADWKVAFANLSLMLAPGGRILVSCPHIYPLHEEPYDFWRPTLHALHYYASRSGLEVIESIPAGTFWDVLGTLIGNTTQVVATQPRLFRRILARSMRLCLRLIYRFIANGFIPRVINVKCPIYLSNIVVLTKQP
jgi:SAM-dependent methyltransferase